MTNAVVLGHSTSPYISMWAFTPGTGFGSKYSNPSSLPVTSGKGVAVSPSGAVVAITSGSSPFVEAYAVSSSGFGSKFSNPSSLPVASNGIVFASDSSFVMVGQDSTPYITAYDWSSSGFGSKWANPGTLPGREPYGKAAIYADKSTMFMGHVISPYTCGYSLSAGAFGSKFSNPGTLPLTHGTGSALSPGEQYLAISHSNNSNSNNRRISVYSVSSAGYGSKFSYPTADIAGDPGGVKWINNSTILLGNKTGSTTGNTVSAYAWTGAGFGSKYADPASAANGITQSPDVVDSTSEGTDVVLSGSVSPYIHAYAWSAGFGSKYSNPSPLPAGVGRGVVFAQLSSPSTSPPGNMFLMFA